MDDTRPTDDDGDRNADRGRDTPRPAHPWGASIMLVTGVVVLLFVLALVSTFR
jgi:hypothetical protein